MSQPNPSDRSPSGPQQPGDDARQRVPIAVHPRTEVPPLPEAATIEIPTVSGLAVRCMTRNEAAEYLGVCMRTLHNRTHPKGPIRPIRWGRRVMYPFDELRDYLREEIRKQTETDDNPNNGDRS